VGVVKVYKQFNLLIERGKKVADKKNSLDKIAHLKKVKVKKEKPKITKLKLEQTRFEPKTERDVAMDFAMKAHERFDRIIKASILFGSQAKNNASASSDIDVILVIDDSAIKWDMELIAWYREELGKLVASLDYGRELHINTLKLTTWWQDLLNGDPVIVNILRYGEALIDSGGFFNPLKALLIDGKIKSTPEAVYNSLERAPIHLARSKAATMGAIEGIYWAMVDSAQAALMMAGKTPPSPEHIPEMLTETFIDSGMIKMDSVRAIRDLYVLHKSISHGEVNHIKGMEIDSWHSTAEKFISEMTRIINILIDAKK